MIGYILPPLSLTILYLPPFIPYNVYLHRLAFPLYVLLPRSSPPASSQPGEPLFLGFGRRLRYKDGICLISFSFTVFLHNGLLTSPVQIFYPVVPYPVFGLEHLALSLVDHLKYPLGVLCAVTQLDGVRICQGWASWV